MQPNQVQLSSNHNLNSSSLSTNLLISASSFSPLNRQSSPLSSFTNSSSILHPIAHHHHSNSHLVHSSQLTNSLASTSIPHPLSQSVLQSAQLLRNNYDNLLYVNATGQLLSSSATNLQNSTQFNAINQLNQLSHHLNQLPIAAAAAAAASLQNLQQQQNENTSDNLSVCSNLSGSLKSEADTTLNTLNSSSNCGFNGAFKLNSNNSIKNSNNLLATNGGQLRCTQTTTPNAVNELKFSVNSILNASNYSNQLRNDGKLLS